MKQRRKIVCWRLIIKNQYQQLAPSVGSDTKSHEKNCFCVFEKKKLKAMNSEKKKNGKIWRRRSYGETEGGRRKLRWCEIK